MRRKITLWPSLADEAHEAADSMRRTRHLAESERQVQRLTERAMRKYMLTSNALFSALNKAEEESPTGNIYLDDALEGGSEAMDKILELSDCVVSDLECELARKHGRLIGQRISLGETAASVFLWEGKWYFLDPVEIEEPVKRFEDMNHREEDLANLHMQFNVRPIQLYTDVKIREAGFAVEALVEALEEILYLPDNGFTALTSAKLIARKALRGEPTS